ncbi:type I secretion C-terminal target domain (VC_A0849 subclass) [Paenisporosarcina quisquiliarum]|jgi:acyl-CoA hydrolase|uniref:Acyl-CoA thioesterase n=1 Tax=Psychrobacillus psychrodurans TaxID=126157 RepID=A0A9X3L9K4_9BACI|nr:acyl-CoA thioesterase [Psychrobacillus psychrodurans]MCZ8533637.1 acyl-CoA thioesterase [Psychrobacillus psychrodurans]SEN32917.1 type I secretion C-terminal target domain (VC_A0849 subclass) [Paenisporosarcina quisquiliarum]
MNTNPMSQSRTIQTHLILPPDTNHHETIFGGRVLAFIDEIAAISSMKHAQGAVVTASIDSVDFLSSAKVGDVLELEAVVSNAGRSSMEVYVRVTSTNLITGEEKLTTESYVTMVAVDDNGKPVPVPGIHPETEAEKRLYETGPARRAHRKQRLEMKY